MKGVFLLLAYPVRKRPDNISRTASSNDSLAPLILADMVLVAYRTSQRGKTLFLGNRRLQRLALNLSHRTILGGLRTQSIGASNLCSAFWTL
jgi:hypothetical protein